MTREAWEYGNPEAVAIRKESRTCKGCIHIAVAFDRRYCNLGKKYGARCKSYSDTKTIQGK
jgi:hypothetical protein